jgi:hypothetical protein
MSTEQRTFVGNDDFDDPVTEYLLPIYPDPDYQPKKMKALVEEMHKIFNQYKLNCKKSISSSHDYEL